MPASGKSKDAITRAPVPPFPRQQWLEPKALDGPGFQAATCTPSAAHLTKLFLSGAPRKMSEDAGEGRGKLRGWKESGKGHWAQEEAVEPALGL